MNDERGKSTISANFCLHILSWVASVGAVVSGTPLPLCLFCLLLALILSISRVICFSLSACLCPDLLATVFFFFSCLRSLFPSSFYFISSLLLPHAPNRLVKRIVRASSHFYFFLLEKKRTSVWCLAWCVCLARAKHLSLAWVHTPPHFTGIHFPVPPLLYRVTFSTRSGTCTAAAACRHIFYFLFSIIFYSYLHVSRFCVFLHRREYLRIRSAKACSA